jgi:hypothetical protein
MFSVTKLHLSRNMTSLIHMISTADRLPIPLGEFISEKVYDGKLRSCHDIVDHSCVAFIDVRKGRETRRGSSYQVSVATG